MATVKVTAVQSHYGTQGMIKAGDTYETDHAHAQELVSNGLVKTPGVDAKKKKDGYVADITLDKPKEKAENKTGNVPTAKKTKK